LWFKSCHGVFYSEWFVPWKPNTNITKCGICHVRIFGLESKMWYPIAHQKCSNWEEILIESIALRAIWWIRVRVHLFFNLDLNGQMCDGLKSRWDMNSCLFIFSCFCPSFFLMSSHRLIDLCSWSYTMLLSILYEEIKQETAPLFLKYFLAMSRWKSQIYHQFLLS
jgi:hypothetical protein